MEHIVNIERVAGSARAVKPLTLKRNRQWEAAPMLIRKVEQFLARHDMPATKFGRLAAHDPRFVLDLRMGRIPRDATEARTLRWMAEFEASAERSAANLPLETKGLAHV